jgi:polysaccharide biosynthesis transport protein
MLPGVRKRVFNFHDVLMYVAIARKHLRLMVLLMCFSWLAGLVYYVYARPVYYSRALVKVNQVKQQLGAEKDFNEASKLPGVVKELTAPHIIAGAAAKLGVKASHQDVMKYHIKKIQARRNSEENIEVEVYPYSFDWAKRWTETLVNQYLEYRQQRRLEEMQERIANYHTQREELLKLLEQGHSKVSQTLAAEDFNKAKIRYDKLRDLHANLVLIGKRLDDVARVRIEILDSGLTAVEKLSRIAGVLESPVVGSGPLTNPGNGGGPENDQARANSEPASAQVITPTLAGTGSTWRSLDKQLHTLQAMRQEKALHFLPEHKVMREIQAEMDAVKVKLEGELRTATNAIEIVFSELLSKQKQLNAQMPEFDKSYTEFLESQQKVEIANSTLTPVKNLLTSLEKSIQSSGLAFDNERIELSYAGVLEISNNPVSPNRMLLVIYTTVLGLFMAIGIPFLVEYLDHTLSNLEQVESTFQLRGLGIIPKVDNADTTVALLDSPLAREQNLLENFRVIRTNLLSMGALSKPPHVLMITSAMPKEGKTVVSTNLALSFAQTGGKTLLMDTDLRRGRLHRFFGYRKQPGLSGVLLGQCTLDEAIRPTPHENLFIISAGQHLETGTELLGSPKFHELMVDLRKRFDRIVMDTPPVLGLSETSVLQSQVDGVLFVIWSGYTPIKGVKAAVEMLQANGANFYGFVLNRLDLSTTANYYQYYYYSHDYYYQYSPRSLENA